MQSQTKPIDILYAIIGYASFFITSFALKENGANFFFLFIYAALAFFTNKFRLENKFVLLGLITIVGFFIVLLFNPLGKLKIHYEFAVIFSSTLTLIAVAAPILLLSTYIIWTISEASTIKKKYKQIISQFPYLICRNHFTRTKDYKTLWYKRVNCRADKKCLKKGDIQLTVNLVGLVGLIEDGKMVDNDYYVTLWDHRSRKIRYGDFDIIEIHESQEMKDYDFVISKVITFFYNEIDRYKPLNETIVRIIGNPPVSENTKRMLQKHFLKVEYLSS